jgi:hypothetical protein
MAYSEPPLIPDSESQRSAAEGFRPLKERLAEKYPLRAEALEWRLLTEPLAAAGEQEELLREASERSAAKLSRDMAEHQGLTGELSRLQEEQGEAARALAVAREGFGEALADAELPWADGEASPAAVEAALQEAVPSLEELAGEHGMAPPPEGSSGSPLELLACLASGSLLALCLGTLVGLLSLTDLQRADRLPALALSALAGGATSGTLGALAACAAGSLALALWRSGPDEMRPSGGLAVALGLCAAAALLLAAEVGAEAIGMRELHRQALQAARRMQDGAAEAALLPLGVYILLGTLVSGPYVGWKAAKVWAKQRAEAEEAWLLGRQRRWLQERRACPEVRRAFALAAQTEGLAAAADILQRRITTLEARRDLLLEGDGLDPETRSLLDDARAAAVGLSSDFQEALTALVDDVEPLRRQRTRGIFG